jgi:hypothetical protein
LEGDASAAAAARPPVARPGSRVPSVMTMCLAWRATRKPAFSRARTASRWLTPVIFGTIQATSTPGTETLKPSSLFCKAILYLTPTSRNALPKTKRAFAGRKRLGEAEKRRPTRGGLPPSPMSHARRRLGAKMVDLPNRAGRADWYSLCGTATTGLARWFVTAFSERGASVRGRWWTPQP